MKAEANLKKSNHSVKQIIKAFFNFQEARKNELNSPLVKWIKEQSGFQKALKIITKNKYFYNNEKDKLEFEELFTFDVADNISWLIDFAFNEASRYTTSEKKRRKENTKKAIKCINKAKSLFLDVESLEFHNNLDSSINFLHQYDAGLGQFYVYSKDIKLFYYILAELIIFYIVKFYENKNLPIRHIARVTFYVTKIILQNNNESALLSSLMKKVKEIKKRINTKKQ